MDETHQPLPEVRRPLIQRTLTEWRTLAILGGPILIAQLAQMANGVIDTVMAGHASAEDLAAVGIGSSLWMPVFLFFMGLLGALQPIISGYNGARSFDRIMPATWQGLYIAAGGSVIMIVLLTNVFPVLNLMQLESNTARVTGLSGCLRVGHSLYAGHDVTAGTDRWPGPHPRHHGVFGAGHTDQPAPELYFHLRQTRYAGHGRRWLRLGHVHL